MVYSFEYTCSFDYAHHTEIGSFGGGSSVLVRALHLALLRRYYVEVKTRWVSSIIDIVTYVRAVKAAKSSQVVELTEASARFYP